MEIERSGQIIQEKGETIQNLEKQIRLMKLAGHREPKAFEIHSQSNGNDLSDPGNTNEAISVALKQNAQLLQVSLAMPEL